MFLEGKLGSEVLSIQYLSANFLIPNSVQDLILTGGVDCTAAVFSRSTGELVSQLSGHGKRVWSSCFEYYMV
jgi:WD40 repeat protein